VVLLVITVGIVIDVIGLMALLYEWRRGAQLRRNIEKLLGEFAEFRQKRKG
jgi:hypothetical protein